MTGALHVLQLHMSPPLTSAPIKSRMETFWYWLTQVYLENWKMTVMCFCVSILFVHSVLWLGYWNGIWPVKICSKNAL